MHIDEMALSIRKPTMISICKIQLLLKNYLQCIQITHSVSNTSYKNRPGQSITIDWSGKQWSNTAGMTRNGVPPPLPRVPAPTKSV